MRPKNYRPASEEQDIRAAFERARDYAHLKESPGWKRLLDFLEARCDGALADLRGCKSSDGAVVAGLLRVWQLREQELLEIQEEVLGSVERAKELAGEIAEYEGRAFNAEEYLDREEMSHA